MGLHPPMENPGSDPVKDIHMENMRQKWIKREGSCSSGVDRTATKSADKVCTQVESESLTQNDISTQMETPISPHKYVGHDGFACLL